MWLLVGQERDPLIMWVTFRFGAWYGRCSRAVARGLDMSSLDGVSTRWVGTLVMGNLMGRRSWVGRGCFSLGGRGGKRKNQGTVNRVGRWTTRAFKQSYFVIYYMLSSGSFTAVCLQAIAKGVLDPRLPWAERALLGLRQPVDLVHTLKTVKGLRLLVPPRTPRSSDSVHC
jgi:hypothetical protein